MSTQETVAAALHESLDCAAEGCPPGWHDSGAAAVVAAYESDPPQWLLALIDAGSDRYDVANAHDGIPAHVIAAVRRAGASS